MQLRHALPPLVLGLLFSCVAEAQGAPTALERIARSLGLTGESHAARQWAHVSSADGEACRAALRAAGVRFRALPDRTSPDARGCGIPHGVAVMRGPTGVQYGGLTMDCSLALRLADFERVAQDEARAQLDDSVVRVGTLGTYNCRSVRGWSSLLSEHAFGNAIDVARFDLRRGRSVLVSRDFERFVAAPVTPRGRFLRRLYDRLRASDAFANVRGPEDDALHRDHFHLDRGVGWLSW